MNPRKVHLLRVFVVNFVVNFVDNVDDKVDDEVGLRTDAHLGRRDLYASTQ